ncbi:hypothetical protein B0T11DRAFT_330522 [Plectosphaerella cucumerina]|uniref:Uncharacterized protein n=1 Tax=Plectosphaerella cucumerina TaxID=40658 RepID=A0A8K0TBD1_9PEZI|nr:hypothetical protein B0T11DRAFT_330522 [Plectosphaerella cucumerina]
MNQLLSILLLAAPAANAMAAYMAELPQQIRAMVETDSCVLPEDFTVSDFTAQSQDNGNTLDAFEFGFTDDKTTVSTTCYFNSTSVPVVEGGRTPRYPCEDARALFIWQNSQLTLIEKVCPGDDGLADYEAAGTAVIEVSCGDDTDTDDTCAGGCSAGEVTARFPVYE